ncbi:MAG TPA: hypothetical protein VGJ86_24005, partial [Acidimicrobiales bacterium]
MSVSAAPPVPRVDLTLTLTTPTHGSRTVDLATRALVVAVVPTPRWGREAEVLAAVAAAADSGADLAEVPAEPRLLGPAAAQGAVPVAVRVGDTAEARAALSAGAALLLVDLDRVEAVLDPSEDHDEDEGTPRPGAPPPSADWPLAVMVDTARAARDASTPTPERPVALDVTRLADIDAVSEESLGLAVGARL